MTHFDEAPLPEWLSIDDAKWAADHGINPFTPDELQAVSAWVHDVVEAARPILAALDAAGLLE